MVYVDHLFDQYHFVLFHSGIIQSNLISADLCTLFSSNITLAHFIIKFYN